MDDHHRPDPERDQSNSTACPVHHGEASLATTPAKAPDGDAPTALTFYQIHAKAPTIRPAKSQRAWMDATPDRFAYRCLPLSIANATGWELVLDAGLRILWNGGDRVSDMRIEALDPADEHEVANTAGSHFGSGIVTFHTGYILRTSPGWGVWARGAPNTVKDGIVPLDGLIETDWLPFPFTMNWALTRPGIVEFQKGDVFCFVTPTPHHALEAIAPTIVPLPSEPELKRDYESWAEARNSFNAGLAEGDPDTVRQGWQRTYMHGRTLEGDKVTAKHASKRKMKAPQAG